MSRINIANMLTGMRLVLVPILLLSLLLDKTNQTNWKLAAFLIFVTAAITDNLDGFLARNYNKITTFGTLADPIADKLLIGSAMIGLSLLNEIPWWATFIILIREIGVTVLRLTLLYSNLLLGNNAVSASYGGKIKTLMQNLAIGQFLFPLHIHSNFWFNFSWTTMWLALVLTVLTGLNYILLTIKNSNK